MPLGGLSPAGRDALARMKQLADCRAQGLLDAPSFIARTLRVLAEGLGCERTSLWLHGDRDGERVLICRGLHDGSGAPAPAAVPAEPPVLVESDHAAYFDALDRHGILCAPDAQQHPALSSMLRGHLLPHDIRSLLDVPFAANGRRIGLLCGEQAGRRIDWQPAQIALMRHAGIAGSLRFERQRLDEARLEPVWRAAAE